MSELVCSLCRRIDAGPFERTSDDAPESARTGEAPDRRPVAQKDTTIGIAWTRLPQVVDNRLANIRGQWQVVALTVLATYIDLSGDPIDIVEFERNYLTRP